MVASFDEIGETLLVPRVKGGSPCGKRAFPSNARVRRRRRAGNHQFATEKRVWLSRRRSCCRCIEHDLVVPPEPFKEGARHVEP
jgi:hypothetical protein